MLPKINPTYSTIVKISDRIGIDSTAANPEWIRAVLVGQVAPNKILKTITVDCWVFFAKLDNTATENYFTWTDNHTNLNKYVPEENGTQLGQELRQYWRKITIEANTEEYAKIVDGQIVETTPDDPDGLTKWDLYTTLPTPNPPIANIDNIYNQAIAAILAEDAKDYNLNQLNQLEVSAKVRKI